MSEPTHYINVDLDLTSDESLQPLLDAWGDQIIVLHQTTTDDGFSVGLEISPEVDSAEETIQVFIDLVHGLSPPLRARWDRLATRDLDVGIQAGTEPRYWRFSLAPQTLQGIQEIGARLACTVYAPYEDEPSS